MGRGGYGEVFLWKHRKNGQEKAVKKVKYGEENGPTEEVKRLQREIDLLKILKHPNIVEYCGNNIINNFLVIIMEYVPEGSVYGLIEKRGALTEKQASRYTKHTLQGLTYLHSNNIIHRDIKCANMLLADGDIVKLCDFGTSKQLDHIYTATCYNLTTNVGTMFYMAPEMFSENGKYSITVDTWSTGCSLVEMLTKNPPWKGFESQRFLTAINKGTKPPFDLQGNISQKVHSFLGDCFCSEAKKRKKAFDLLGHPFCTE